MIDATALRSARPDVLEQTARDWTGTADGLEEQEAALRLQVIAPLRKDWEGQAADKAIGTLTAQVKDLEADREYASAMAALMRDAADGIRDAQRYLKQADDLATRNGLAVGADGSVGAAGSLLSVDGVVHRVEELFEGLPLVAAEIRALAERALRLAREVDERVTAQLKKIGLFEGPGTGSLAAAGTALAAAAALGTALDGQEIPARGTDPKKVSAWWKSLSPEEQRRLTDEFPSKIGWLDGLPATARSKANFLAMNREEAQLHGQLQSLTGSEPPQWLLTPGPHEQQRVENPAWAQWSAQVSSINQKLAEINAVNSGVSRAAKTTGQQVFLLGFDTDGIGHAIVAVGNPDTATNTATYVPGLGTHLSGAGNPGGDIDRTAALYNATSTNLAPGQKISSVYWLGYNPPQKTAQDIVHVAGTGDAVAGAANLTGFQNGLGAAHQPGIAHHTTVIGHSYGSLVVGEAATRDHLKPNDIVFVGSPGVGVDHASQLGISPSHVWAGANAHDPVPTLSPELADPAPAFPVPDNNPDGESPYNQSWFGTNPATAPFGGHRFEATQGTNQTYSGLDWSAHSAYWDTRSSSLDNMSLIIKGDYAHVSRAK